MNEFLADNKIVFEIKDGQLTLSYKKAIPVTDFLQIVQTGILSTLNQVVAASKEEIRTQVKEDLYDMYNAAASSTLNFFAPEIEMRPHLTAQAILEAENKIIERQYRNKKKQMQQAHAKHPAIRRIK